MINLQDWDDYRRSASVVRCVEYNLKNNARRNIVISGVKHAIKSNAVVSEDNNYILQLVGLSKNNRIVGRGEVFQDMADDLNKFAAGMIGEKAP